MEAFQISPDAQLRLELAADKTIKLARKKGEPLHSAREVFMTAAAYAFDDFAAELDAETASA